MKGGNWGMVNNSYTLVENEQNDRKITTKKKAYIIGIIIFAIFICTFMSDGLPVYSEEEKIQEIYSPDHSVKMNIYQGPPADAVMVDFYVVCEMEDSSSGRKDVVYYRNHEEHNECYWLDNETVVINGEKIDITDKNTWIKDFD